MIGDIKQPLLVTTPKKSDARKTITVIHLVPELCTLTGLTDDVSITKLVNKEIYTT